MDKYQIILADDHILFCEGLKRVIEESPDLKVVGVVHDGFQLLDTVKKIDAHLAIVDISMPSLSGIEAIVQLKANRPQLKILIITMHKDKTYVYRATKAGADGYLLKEDANIELFKAIKMIRKGNTYISPILLREFSGDFMDIYRGDRKLTEGLLTLREKEVLRLIVEGKTSKEIADLLFISPRTMENHRAKIMKKLGVKKSVELVRYAIQERLIPACHKSPRE